LNYSVRRIIWSKNIWKNTLKIRTSFLCRLFIIDIIIGLEMKKIIIVTNSHLIEVDESYEWGSDEAQDFELKIHNAGITCDKVVVDDNHKAKLIQSSIELVDPKEKNCGQCARCGAWVADYEKPEPVEGLGIGARVNGELLCDECLPSDHPLAF
jgi:hypothetical protein